MPDNQQRAQSAGKKLPKDTPSTGRRGSHSQADAEKPAGATRSTRKQNSLHESPTPVEQGGD
jgi:hypothetical protein